MSALIILLDGFNPDDINSKHTPYLEDFKKKNSYSLLEKSAPFCERSEFYSGQPAKVTNNFFAFDYNTEASNYRYIKNKPYFTFFKFLDISIDFIANFGFQLHILDKVKRKIRTIFQKKIIQTGEKFFSVNHIPYKFLSRFSLTEDSEIPQIKFNSYPTSFYNQANIKDKKILNLFDDLCIHNKKIDYNNRLDFLNQKLIENKNDIYLYANSELDLHMHNNGIKKDFEYIEKIKKIDTDIKETCSLFLNLNPSGKIFIFSPHGMLNVKIKINVEKYILKHISNSNNTYFIDSTAFRIWGSHLNNIWSKLSNISVLKQNGNFMWSHILYKNYNCKKHIIWFANTETICFPDFFRRTIPPLGMHGYSNLKVQNGFILSNAPLFEKKYLISDLSWIINDNLL